LTLTEATVVVVVVVVGFEVVVVVVVVVVVDLVVVVGAGGIRDVTTRGFREEERRGEFLNPETAATQKHYFQNLQCTYTPTCIQQ